MGCARVSEANASFVVFAIFIWCNVHSLWTPACAPNYLSPSTRNAALFRIVICPSFATGTESNAIRTIFAMIAATEMSLTSPIEAGRKTTI